MWDTLCKPAAMFTRGKEHRERQRVGTPANQMEPFAALPAHGDRPGARSEWAARLALEPTDALYLAELVEAPRTIPEIAASLDGYGPQRGDVRLAIERLVRVRLMEPVAPPPAPPPPPRRW